MKNFSGISMMRHVWTILFALSLFVVYGCVSDSSDDDPVNDVFDSFVAKDTGGTDDPGPLDIGLDVGPDDPGPLDIGLDVGPDDPGPLDIGLDVGHDDQCSPDYGEDSTEQDTFVPTCPDSPPATCPLFVTEDRFHHLFCRAFNLPDPADGDLFVTDEVCNGPDEHNWFKLQVRAKRLIQIYPDGADNSFPITIFRSAVKGEPQGEEDLIEVVNHFTDRYHWYFAFDGEPDAPIDLWIKITAKNNPFAYSLIIKEFDTTYDCVDMNLTTLGYEYFYGDGEVALGSFVGGLKNWDDDPTATNSYIRGEPADVGANTQACIKELADPDDSEKGFAVMKVVRCVDGELITAYDCQDDFPQWTMDLAEQYGPLVCAHNSHPVGQLWCEPKTVNIDHMGVCELNGITRGMPTCLTDPVTGESRYMIACQSNLGFLFTDNPDLYSPFEVDPNSGYFVGLDCRKNGEPTKPDRNPEDAVTGVCGEHPWYKTPSCLYERERFIAGEEPPPQPFPSTNEYANFPITQNIVSWDNPGEGNTLPYVELDTIGMPYTSAGRVIMQEGMTNLLADGRLYLGYMNIPWPEGGGASIGPGWVGNNARWASMGYEYAYWADRFAIDMGLDGMDLAPFERGCYDADNDGWDNRADLCPLAYDPDQTDTDQDGMGDACDPFPTTYAQDIDSDGVYNADGGDADNYPDDNCPMVGNPSQTDTDFNGIGDVCQPAEVTCNPAGPGWVACADENGNARRGPATMTWVWNMASTKTQNILISLNKALAGMGAHGMTNDMASMANCFNDETTEMFAQFVANGCRMDRSIVGSADPNDQGRLRACESIEGDPADPANCYDDGCFKAWELFKHDVFKDFMARLGNEMTDFMGPDHKWATFYNQGRTNMNNFRNFTVGQEWALAKTIAGCETFIGGGDPIQGNNVCLGTDITAYPASGTLEMVFDMHDQEGVRFWSWNTPSELPDDRMVLYAAESLAHGGIFQVGSGAVEFFYPYNAYGRPNHVMRLANAPVAPFVSAVWEHLSLPRAKGQIAFYVPQSLFGGCMSSYQFGSRTADQLYRVMTELHYPMDVLGRGSLDSGKARLPTVEELLEYDFIVIGYDFMGDQEIDVFEEYLAEGGKLVITSQVGLYDEWCADMFEDRQDWLELSQDHGFNPIGENGGGIYQLGNLAEAWQKPDGTWLDARTALEYLKEPNAGLNRCLGSEGNPVTDNFEVLPVADLPGERGKLRAWIEGRLMAWNALGLPNSRLAPGLSPDIHLTTRMDSAGLPVYHLVNYALNSVSYSPFYFGTLSGSDQYRTYTVPFGCAKPTTVSGWHVTVPESLRATGGQVKVVALDYRPPQTSFFPNDVNPESPCETAPLDGEYPEDRDWQYPTWTQAFGAGATTVTLNFPMKQWAIVWFE